jgi:hypothetical protein
MLSTYKLSKTAEQDIPDGASRENDQKNGDNLAIPTPVVDWGYVTYETFWLLFWTKMTIQLHTGDQTWDLKRDIQQERILTLS